MSAGDQGIHVPTSKIQQVLNLGQDPFPGIRQQQTTVVVEVLRKLESLRFSIRKVLGPLLSLQHLRMFVLLSEKDFYVIVISVKRTINLKA